MSKKKIAFVFGTRPEAIKMAPLIKAVSANENFLSTVILTGQHPTMAKEVLGWFGLLTDFELTLERDNSNLNTLLAKIIQELSPKLEELNPDLVLVQGDTASAFAGATAAFNLGIKVAHLEAGLRTSDLSSPFPEEGYRQLISRLATLHLCPTKLNKANLLSEGIHEESIMITGNTVVDAFEVIRSQFSNQRNFSSEVSTLLTQYKLVLVTAHRRENIGFGMDEIAESIDVLAAEFPEVHFVIPLHPNPLVRASFTQRVSNKSNVSLLDPLDYPTFIALLEASTLVMTDSGGVQEEAPILGVPVLVMRENTERPEGVSLGGVKLVGAKKVNLVSEVRKLLSDSDARNLMASATNPYGDGFASSRVLSALLQLFELGHRESEFSLEN